MAKAILKAYLWMGGSMSSIQTMTPVSKPQIKRILLARGQEASRFRGGLIALLAERTQIPNLAELSTGELVGELIALEEATEPLGRIIQSIIAPTPIEEPESHKAARRIMGDNFLGIPEVAKAFGPVSLEAQAMLVVIPFDKATLRSCCDTHVLVADIGLSLIDVRGRMKRGLFYSYEDSWYNAEEFAKRTEQATWRLIRKTPVTNSTSGKTWDEQKALLGEQDEIPTARRLVYAIMLVFATTDERLFKRIYVRTNDVDSLGNRVDVGHFDGCGLSVNNWHGHDRYNNVGVSSSQKVKVAA